MNTAALSAGLSLKPEHFDEARACRASGLWLEVHPENYMVAGGPRLAWLHALREAHPLSMHGVSLSLGGHAPPDARHLERLAALVRRFEPALVSEHLAWCHWGDAWVPDLLPIVRSDEALRTIARNVSQAQDALARPIAIENPAHYLELDSHEWSEPDFLRELARRTGCRLLLDINNVVVSAHNLRCSPQTYLDDFPFETVEEIHLAGHRPDPGLGDALWIDSHDAPVAETVWALYAQVIERAGPRPTLIERDAKLPAFDTLLSERDRAEAVLRAAARTQDPVTA